MESISYYYDGGLVLLDVSSSLLPYHDTNSWFYLYVLFFLGAVVFSPTISYANFARTMARGLCHEMDISIMTATDGPLGSPRGHGIGSDVLRSATAGEITIPDT